MDKILDGLRVIEGARLRCRANYLVPGAPLQFSGAERGAPRRAPVLGEQTDEVLSDVLGLSGGQIGKLGDRKLVTGPVELP